MRGNITKRGRNSWRLKFDLGIDPVTKKRKTAYHTFRGTRKQAETKLTELMSSVDQSKYVEPSKITVAELVPARVDLWEASSDISARTAERYRQLVKHQIVPHLGDKLVQKLKPDDIKQWRATLLTSGKARGEGNLSPRTISHARKVLAKALGDAAENEIVHRNVAQLNRSKRRKADDDNGDNMVIVKDVPDLLKKLQGSLLRLPAMLALLCGLRLGEVLALRWGRIEGKVLQVREAIEQTKKHGIRFKETKSKAGRRDITMPDEVVEALATYRREQLELRLQLGLGRLTDATLLFWDEADGRPRSIYTMSRAWGELAARIGLPDVTYHALRHTHASQLIDAGVDIVTISKRLGHAKPDITLRVYAHLFKNDDSKAATAINAALRGA